MNKSINELQKTIASINAEIKNLQCEVDNFEYTCDESEFDAHLDECYKDVNVCGFTYSASYALKELDPIAYRCMKSDYEGTFDLNDCTEYTDMVEELASLESELESLNDELNDLENEVE